MSDTKAARCVLIHGHFYQPPRENPWLEEVEREESAQPHHDWNDRIFHECYGPNLAAPILDPEGRVLKLVDNYDRLSFNFGPTLLSWMERHHPAAYRRLIESDRRSVRERGHGNALAQAYNHVILPLASERDKRTQIRWGLADFSSRFGRPAEGMWLPETAVDAASLEALIDEGVRFTVLAPHQALRVRPLGAEAWTDVTGETLDTTRAYRWSSRRRPGRHIDLFFYNAPLSRAVAFERALSDGRDFGQRLVSAFLDEDRAQLVHIATDGESYGHHHRFGEMGLAFALEWIERSGAARVVNYAQYLDIAPPAFEADIREKTAWSCAHGLGRWSEDCGCKVNPEWHQKWRAPLRSALDELASKLDSFYETAAAGLFKEPWAVRDAYIERLLSGEARSLLTRHTFKHLSAEEVRTALMLLELQRHRLLMFTSCGWFFDDVSGLETQQVLKYACRAIELARTLGRDFEGGFLEGLRKAPSNIPAFQSGDVVYAKLALPRKVDLRRAAANAAIVESFEEPSGEAMHAAFDASLASPRRLTGFEKSLFTAHVRISNRDTFEETAYSCAVVHRARLDVECWIKEASSDAHEGLHAGLAAAFAKEDDLQFAQVCRRLYESSLDLEALFIDERTRIVKNLLHPPSEAWWVILKEWNAEVRRPARERDLGRLFHILERARDLGVPLERLPHLREVFHRLTAALLTALKKLDAPALREASRLVETAWSLPFYPGRWELRLHYAERRRPLDAGALDEETRRAVEDIELRLGFAPIDAEDRQPVGATWSPRNST